MGLTLLSTLAWLSGPFDHQSDWTQASTSRSTRRLSEWSSARRVVLHIWAGCPSGIAAKGAQYILALICALFRELKHSTLHSVSRLLLSIITGRYVRTIYDVFQFHLLVAAPSTALCATFDVARWRTPYAEHC